MSRIGFIGTGHIAAPMVRLLATKGHEIAVTRRNDAVSARLQAEVGVSVSEPQDVIDTSDTIVLCLRPHVAPDILAPLTFRAGQTVISVMAGISRPQLETLCAPCTDFVQTIPLGFLEQGGCPLPAFGNSAALASLFEPENPVVPVASEAALNAHFAVCAMVPGLLDLMATGAAWLGEQTGNADRAAFYTSQLMAGFLHSMEKDGAAALPRERDALATDGTLSLQMTQSLRDGHAHEVLTDALTAIGKRLEGDA